VIAARLAGRNISAHPAQSTVIAATAAKLFASGKTSSTVPADINDTRITGRAPMRSLKRPPIGPKTIADAP